MARTAEWSVGPAQYQYAAYHVGDLTLDVNRKALLTAHGAEVPLRPKSFSMLLLLVENAGRILSNEAIMSAVWPDLFVTENNVKQCVHEIRRALGPEAQQILRTRPRHGYLVPADVVGIRAAKEFGVGASPSGPIVSSLPALRSVSAMRVDGSSRETVDLKLAPHLVHDRDRPAPPGVPVRTDLLNAAKQELQVTDRDIDDHAPGKIEGKQSSPIVTPSSANSRPGGLRPGLLSGETNGAKGLETQGADSGNVDTRTVDDVASEVGSSSPAPRLSLVVLPFVNLCGDPKEEYFVDGITECLTTDLSRIRGAFVIARNTAFTYKGKALDARTIGRELNIRYVLDGSVQRVGKRMRVSVRFVDAENGHHLWAERFDKPVANFFELQDEISARLASQLGSALLTAEARRSERSLNPDAFDLYLQGMALINMGPYPAHLSQARALFGRALSLEPDNVDALVGSGCADFWEVADWTSAERGPRLAAAEASLSRALASAPENALAHLLLSGVKTYSNRPVQGIADAERALSLDRNLAAALVTIGLAKHFVGRPEETEGYVRQAIRLSPRDRLTFIWFGVVGASKLHVGAYEDATSWLTQSVAVNPNFATTRFLLAAALGQLDRKAEAAAEAQAALALNPVFTIGRCRANPDCNSAAFLQQRENVYDGLRKAQVPEF